MPRKDVGERASNVRSHTKLAASHRKNVRSLPFLGDGNELLAANLRLLSDNGKLLAYDVESREDTARGAHDRDVMLAALTWRRAVYFRSISGRSASLAFRRARQMHLTVEDMENALAPKERSARRKKQDAKGR